MTQAVRPLQKNGVFKLMVIKEGLEEVIGRCATASYSLDDAYLLRKLASLLVEEARLIAECCT